jgi:tape measure domain-containing protein
MAVNSELTILLRADDRASRPLGKLKKQIADVGKTTSAMGKSFRALSATVGLGGAGLGSAAITAGYAFNSFQEQSQLAFATILKDGGKAQKLVSDIQEVAKATPFDTESLTRATQRLLAFGVSADDVLPMLTDISDTVSGLGGGAEMIDRVTNAFGQMTAKGKAQTEELMQLAEAGIPVWKILADNIGEISPRLADAAASGKITQTQLVDQIQKMVAGGKLKAPQAIAMLRKGMAQQFGGLSKVQSQTVGGATSTFKDTLLQLLGDLTKGPFKETAGALLGMADALDRLRDYFKDLPQPIQTAISWLATLTVGLATIGTALLGASGLLALLGAPGLLGVLGTVAGFIGSVVVGAIGLLLSPIGLVVLAVAGLALAWATNFLGIRDATAAAVKWIADRLGDLIKGAGDFARAVGHAWSDLVSAVATIVRVGWQGIVDQFNAYGRAALTVLEVVVGLWVLAFHWLVDAVGPILAGGWEYAVTLFQWLGDTAGAVLATAWGYVAGLFSWLVEAVDPILRAGWTGVVALFQWLSDTVGGILQTGWGYVAGLFDWLYGAVVPISTGTANAVASIFTWLRDVAADAMRWMGDSIAGTFGWMRDAILGIVVPAWQAVAGIFTWLRDTGADAVHWLVERVVQLFGWMRDQIRAIWQPIVDLIERARRAGASVIGGVGGVVSIIGNNIPGFAQGGVVPGALGSPSLAMVHGGEEITPAGRAGGRTIVVQLNAPVYGFANFEDAVRRAIDRADARGRF